MRKQTFPQGYGTLYADNKEYLYDRKLNSGGYILTPFNIDSIKALRIHNTEGYVDDAGNYYYYRRDHLGNNREVWQFPPSGGQGAVIQRTQYYPSGLPWAYTVGDGADKQPYKYGGKAFIEEHGYDAYDSHARMYHPDYMRTPTLDPLAEKYYSISPYVWCGNNPMGYVDPTGETIRVYYDDRYWDFNGTEAEIGQAPDNQFIRDFLTAYFYNKNNGGGESLIEAATNSKFLIGLRQGGEKKEGTSKFDVYGTKDVIWYSNIAVKTTDGWTMSPATVLDHEFGHAVGYFTNPEKYLKSLAMTEKEKNDPKLYYKARDRVYDSQYGKKEERRVITGTEARTAQANYEYPNGYVRPNHYSGGHIRVQDPRAIVSGTYSNTQKIIQMRKKRIWWR